MDNLHIIWYDSILFYMEQFPSKWCKPSFNDWIIYSQKVQRPNFSSRESFTWIILKTILCLVLGFPLLKSPAGCLSATFQELIYLLLVTECQNFVPSTYKLHWRKELVCDKRSRKKPLLFATFFLCTTLKLNYYFRIHLFKLEIISQPMKKVMQQKPHISRARDRPPFCSWSP